MPSTQPVQRVRYAVEDTRVGQKTNYDKLVLEVWTDGTVTPDMALVEAAKILRKHLNPFVQYFDSARSASPRRPPPPPASTRNSSASSTCPIGDLDLSVRASNCLESAKIQTVADLVSHRVRPAQGPQLRQDLPPRGQAQAPGHGTRSRDGTARGLPRGLDAVLLVNVTNCEPIDADPPTCSGTSPPDSSSTARS
jgi:hypothetical protein